MLFPSHRQAVRMQSNDAQTRLDRQLYTSTAANPSFEPCKRGGPQMQFSSQLAPPTLPSALSTGDGGRANTICQYQETMR